METFLADLILVWVNIYGRGELYTEVENRYSEKMQ
jgi:hypothetical protein